MENKLYAIYTEIDGEIFYLGWRMLWDENYNTVYNFFLDNEDSDEVAFVHRAAIRRNIIELVLRQLQRDIKRDPALSCSVRGRMRVLAKLEFKIGEFVCQS